MSFITRVFTNHSNTCHYCLSSKSLPNKCKSQNAFIELNTRKNLIRHEYKIQLRIVVPI